jgi:hypothetical protein
MSHKSYSLTGNVAKLNLRRSSPAEQDVSIRVAAQIALLGRVPPRLRAFSIDSAHRLLSCRFVFDGEPSFADTDTTSAVVAEIVSHHWESLRGLNEEHLAVPMPGKIDHLRLVIFERCEESWTNWTPSGR